MKSRSGSVLLAAAALLVAFCRPGAWSYGDQSQVLTVGVSQFQGLDLAYLRLEPDTYVYNAEPSNNWEFIAPLGLPDGALIEQLCIFANDTNASDFGVLAYLTSLRLAEVDETPFPVSIPGAAAQSNGAAGYGSWCSAPFSYTVRGKSDVDGDGDLDTLVHYLTISLPYPGEGKPGFGGAQITWRRQVSPPPDTPTFGDVPASHPFYGFIEALAGSGITGGCGNGFCPDAPLTRGQMAVFLAKALGLHWAD